MIIKRNIKLLFIDTLRFNNFTFCKKEGLNIILLTKDIRNNFNYINYIL